MRLLLKEQRRTNRKKELARGLYEDDVVDDILLHFGLHSVRCDTKGAVDPGIGSRQLAQAQYLPGKNDDGHAKFPFKLCTDDSLYRVIYEAKETKASRAEERLSKQHEQCVGLSKEI